MPRDIAVFGNQLIVADGSNGNLKVFDRRSGKLVRVIGRAGDGPGEIRRLHGLVVDELGVIHSIDYSRRVVARRDSTGRLLSEWRILGQWNGVAVVNTGSGPTVVLTGRSGTMSREDGALVDAAPALLHEVDTTGVLRSYHRVTWPASPWKRTFTNYFSSADGAVLALGGYGTDVVHFRDWKSGREWADTLRAPWLRRIAWPPDDTFGSGPVADQMRAWAREQTLVSRVFMAGPTRYVAQVQLYDGAGSELWGYVVSSLDGQSRLVAQPNVRRFQHVRGDTAFALVDDENGDYSLETRVIRQQPRRP